MKNRLIFLNVCIVLILFITTTTSVNADSFSGGRVTIDSSFTTLQEAVEATGVTDVNQVSELIITSNVSHEFTRDDLDYLNTMSQLQVLDVANTIIVPEIDFKFFYKHNNIRTVIFPAVSISAFSFSECPNLTSVNMPLLEYASRFLYDCDSLTSLSLDNLTGASIFFLQESDALTVVDLPKVTYFYECFYYMDNLREIHAPELTSMERSLNLCTKLDTINMPKLTTLKGYNFNNCWSITKFSFPKLEEAGYSAFKGCKNTTEISLPKVTKIGTNFAIDCIKLKKVNLSSLKQTYDSMFGLTYYVLEEMGSSKRSFEVILGSEVPEIKTSKYDVDYDPSTENAYINVPTESVESYDLADGEDNNRFNNWMFKIKGTVDIVDTPRYGDEISATVSSPNASDNKTYKWYKVGSYYNPVTYAKTFTLNESDIGKEYFLRVSSTDVHGYIESEKVIIKKAIQTEIPTPPVVDNVTHKSADILSPKEGHEYGYQINPEDEIVWQSSRVFTGLSGDTTYSFYSRIPESNTHEASEKSLAAVITTETDILTGSVTLDNTDLTFGEIINVTAVLNNTGDLNYQWYRDNSPIINETSTSYTTTESDIHTKISCRVVDTGDMKEFVVSNITQPVKKLTREAPPKPIIGVYKNTETITNTYISLEKVDGCEYAINNNWQNKNYFTKLSPLTEYSIKQRYAETDHYYASPSSEVLTVMTTDNIFKGGIELVYHDEFYFGGPLNANVWQMTLDFSVQHRWQDDDNNNLGDDLYLKDKNGNVITYLNPIIIEEYIGKRVRAVMIISGHYDDIIYTEFSPVIEKAPQDKPAKPITDTISYYSLKVKFNSSYEYSMDNGLNWQDTSEFSGLNPNTEYSITHRKKETNTHYASPNSDTLTLKTLDDRLKGTITLNNNAPRFNDVLSVSKTELNNKGDLAYQWQRNNVDIAGANSAEYTVKAEDIGSQLNLVVEDSGVMVGSLESDTSMVVTKALKSKPSKPTVQSIDYYQITIMPEAGVEYSNDGGVNWQSSNEFISLEHNTEYSFATRYTETPTHFISEMSDCLVISTLDNTLKGTLEVDNKTPIVGDTLKATLNGGNNTSDISYTWLRNNSEIVGEVSSEYVVVQGDIGAKISVKVEDSGSRVGALLNNEISTIPKMIQEKPSKPEIASISYNRIEVKQVDNVEYSIDNGNNYQVDNVFTNLNQQTKYNICIRYKESILYSASGKSNTLVVTTYKKPKTVLTHTQKLFIQIMQTPVNQNGYKELSYEMKSSENGTASLKLPSNFLAKKTLLELKSDFGSIHLNTDMFNKETNDIEVVIHPIENIENNIKKSYNISLKINEKVIDFTSQIDFRLALSTDISHESHKLVAVYINEKGQLEIIPNSCYQDGQLVFFTNHLSVYGILQSNVSFSDINTHWAKLPIEFLASRQLIKGYKGRYFPNDTITRAEYITILTRYFNLEFNNEQGFSDVVESDWFYRPAVSAKSNNWLPNHFSKVLDANKAITREEMIYILYKALESSSRLSLLESGATKIDSFKDVNLVSAYAYSSLDYMISRGIINGYNNHISPTSTATRAEVASMLYKLILKILK